MPGPAEVKAVMNSWTKWQDDMRAAFTIITVLVLVSVLAAVCVGLLLGN